ncbi:MAG: hypothetical protein D6761_04570 [Candidatus Dadabacteria bacterium]|nr:MAG: hypothetical protein D6761_04570 [Candidatus Dadabacteria bacterium]
MRRLLAIWVVLLLTAPAAAAGPPAGRTVAVDGFVTVERAGGRVELLVGDTLYAGDRVRTGQIGRVEIEQPDGTILVLDGGADLTIVQAGDETERRPGILDMLWGRLRVQASRWLSSAETRFEVRLPSAIAGVRGTDFVVEQRQQGASVAVLDGKVDVRARSGGWRQAVAPGQQVRFGAGRPPVVQRLSAAQQQRLRQLLARSRRVRWQRYRAEMARRQMLLAAARRRGPQAYRAMLRLIQARAHAMRRGFLPPVARPPYTSERLARYGRGQLEVELQLPDQGAP